MVFLGAIGECGFGLSGVDADNDGLPDAWEQTYGFNSLVADSAGDLDGDGLTNLEEYTAHTNPNLSDTDGDGVGDAQEVNLYFSDPNLKDTDGDGYTDLEEVNAGTSASSSVEYPDWNATLTFYLAPLNAQESIRWMDESVEEFHIFFFSWFVYFSFSHYIREIF